MYSNDTETESIRGGDWDEVRNKFSSLKDAVGNARKYGTFWIILAN